MKIHRIYNELNEIEDISRDKVVITMSASLYEELHTHIWRAKYSYNLEETKKFFRLFDDLLEKAEENKTTEWAK